MDPTQAIARAHPPETLEGWYALHQIFSIDRNDQSSGADRPHITDATPVGTTPSDPLNPRPENGWSACVRLIGSRADLMVIHFRPTLDAISEVQTAFNRFPVTRNFRLVYSFLSVSEAGLYHLTAQLAREAAARGGAVGDDVHAAELSHRLVVERENPFVQRRLYPALPDQMPYVCFYPMSKRRQTGQNWYTLSLEERSRLMQEHGMSGRRYAGRVLQIITGALGFESWEWGVTLFGKDPLDFKKIVTEMRFDEASSKYGEFGDFYVGKLVPGGGPERDLRSDLERAIETI